MRYLAPLLAKLFPPASLQPADFMDRHDEAAARAADPIACAIDEAVQEHARAAAYARDNFDRRVRSTLDELLERMGTQA